MQNLWNKNTEIDFFEKAIKFASPEQLFYLGDDGKYYAYWPKSYKGKTQTMQARNSLIGNFTEKYTETLLANFAKSKGWFAVQSVICNDLGLTNQSPADVALCKSKNRIQKISDIIVLFEIKMSIVWNWQLVEIENNKKLVCLGDYKTHKGNPGLLRSDSMLKAIGKSINIRVSGYETTSIPIIILGNTPITKNYFTKVDHLKKSGIIQGFWSVNPKPLDNYGENIKKTYSGGFIRMDSYSELISNLEKLTSIEQNYFSSMKTKKDLGSIIEISNREKELEKKAEKFLSLIRS